MPDPTSPPVSGQTIRRTARDEGVDSEHATAAFLAHKYREWPNEAGFDGLTEERGPIEIEVTGAIPAWVAGSLYRTGPGVSTVPDTAKGAFRISHWFDGLAHTHRFDIVPRDQDGRSHAAGDAPAVRVFYSSRRQSDQLMKQIQESGSWPLYSFAQRSDPCLGLFGKFMAAFTAARTPRDRLHPGAENICVVLHAHFPGPDGLVSNGASPPSPSPPPPPPPARREVALPGGHRAAVPRSLWVSTDNASLKQVDPATLEPIGIARQAALHPSLRGPESCAHAGYDPDTGDLFNFNLDLGRHATYRVFRVSAATGRTDVLATVRGGADVRPAYIHSLYVSPSFVVLCIPSSHFLWGGLKLGWERSVLESIKPFDAADATRWIVVDRRHGRGVVAQFDTPAGFFFHTTNAFEERDDQDRRDGTVSLFCEVVEYPTTDILYSLYYDVILNRDGRADQFWGDRKHVDGTHLSLVRRRVRIPVPAAPSADGDGSGSSSSSSSNKSSTVAPSRPAVEVVRSIPSPHCGELPTINPAFATRRHRYVYGLPNRGLSTLVDGIVKTDVDTGEALLWSPPPGHTPGEAIFVPRPGAADEDDGALLSVVLDGHAQASYLLCLDARTMTELGRAEVGFAVGIGFHGVHTRG